MPKHPFQLSEYFVRQREIINARLNDYLRPSDHDGRIFAAMRYALMGNGKRIRPILCIAAAEALGGKYEDVLAAACALEMIHTYSLIHDDLPAMDDDGMRRGKPTCHVAFDEATAVLAGDALLTLAFEIMADLDDSSVNPQIQIGIIRVIARAAGPFGMIWGQMQDIRSEGRSLTPAELKSLYALKTGALINASIETGARLAGCDAERLKALKVYAEKTGLAFQVADDILNVEGDPKRMGKAVGTDVVRNKSTYPALLGLEDSKTFAKKLIADALVALESFDHRADPLRAIANYIVERSR